MRKLIAAAVLASVPVWSWVFAGTQTREQSLEEVGRLYQQGKQLVEKGDYKAANQDFLKAQEILKQNTVPAEALEEKKVVPGSSAPADAIHRADYLYNEAVIAIKNEEFKKAQTCLEEAVRLNPNDKDAYYNLGILYEVYLKDKREAVKCYLRYVLLEVDSQKAARVRLWLEGLRKKGGDDD
jgi:tetratricopeptide (TPR) repeat protein